MGINKNFSQLRPRKIRCEICGKILKARPCFCTSPRFKAGRLVQTSKPNPECFFCHGTGISYVCPNLSKHRLKKPSQPLKWKLPKNTHLGKTVSAQKFKPKDDVTRSKKPIQLHYILYNRQIDDEPIKILMKKRGRRNFRFHESLWLFSFFHTVLSRKFEDASLLVSTDDLAVDQS